MYVEVCLCVNVFNLMLLHVNFNVLFHHLLFHFLRHPSEVPGNHASHVLVVAAEQVPHQPVRHTSVALVDENLQKA